MPSLTPIYRIIHINNLRVLLEDGGIWCGNAMKQRGTAYQSIGNQALTEKRAARLVNCCNQGNLNDYVPFYFCPRSVMLFQIHKRHESTYMGGQEPVIHLESNMSILQRMGLPFFFTDRHAFKHYAKQIDDPTRLSELDWTTINSEWWNNTLEDNERQERKMAECLVYRFVPWKCILRIGVYSKRYKDEAEAALRQFGLNTSVDIRTGWYYN